jgi:iron complex transport system ATP-binding protein
MQSEWPGLQVNDIALSRGGNLLYASLSFAITRSSCLAVLGNNGSGKSTLIRSLIGELPCASFDALVYEESSKKSISFQEALQNQYIGYLPQDCIISEDWIVCDFLQEFVHKERNDYVALMQILEAQEICFEKLIVRRMTELSGGERQLVFLIYAILSAKYVLLLDEPTNNLDGAHRRAVLECLSWTLKNKQCAMLLASHDYYCVAKLARDVLYLQGLEQYKIQSLQEFLVSPASRKLFLEVGACL